MRSEHSKPLSIHLIPNQEKQHRNDKTSEQVASEIAQFLALGGKIKTYPPGVSVDTPTLTETQKHAIQSAGKRERTVKRTKHKFAPCLTITEFAESLNKDLNWLRRLIYQGELTATPAVRGLPRLITPEEQERFKQWLERKE